MTFSRDHRRTVQCCVYLVCALLAGSACKETEITDVPVDVATIDVNPTSLTLQLGEVVQVSAVAKSASGRSLTARSVQWSSSNTSVAEVTQTGTVTARGLGDATLTATSGTAAKEVPVTVRAPARIAIDPVTVRFDAVLGGPDPQSQTVNIANSGSGVITGLDVNIVYTQGQGGWLANSTVDRSSTPAVITLRASIAGLIAGTHVATITVTGTNATNNPQTVTVTLVVAQPAGSPTISNPAFTVVGLNSANCATVNGGSHIALSFSFTDANGNVSSGNTVSYVFTGQPSGVTANLSTTQTTVTGTGFNGTVTFEQCIRYSLDTLVTFDVRLRDSSGLESNEIRISIPRPTGAN